MMQNKRTFSITSVLPLLLLFLGFFSFFYFHLYHYLSFETLRLHRVSLLQWTEQHYFITVLAYMLIYTLVVATSVPGATVLTIFGGFLFGVIPAATYVVVSATLGSALVFLAVRTAIGDRLARKASNWIERMEQGFQNNAFNYLVFLRLVPIFPYWLVNIVPALLNVRLKIFVIATVISAIPVSCVYAWVGNGLDSIFAAGQTPNLEIIFSPNVLMPLLGLSLLALVPIVYKKFRRVDA